MGQPVDAVQLKECINYHSKDVPDRQLISVLNDTPEYHTVIETLKNAHAEYTARGYVEYSKEEIEHSPYYQLKLAYPLQSQSKFWAIDFGVQYDFSCDECKRPSAIIRQLTPMKLDLTKIGKWQMFIVPPAIIVREDVKAAIETAGLDGVSFEKVMDYRGRDIEAVHYQMHISHILPAMTSYTIKTNGGFLPCKSCGRTVTHLENTISYSVNDFSTAKDFNLSQEHIFNYDVQEIIISKRARDIIKKTVRRCNCIPVLFFENIPTAELNRNKLYAANENILNQHQ